MLALLNGCTGEIVHGLCDDTKKFKEFSVLDNDEACFRFMYNWEISKGKKFDEFNLKENNKKDKTIALELKKKGNTEFQAEQWNAALELYNQSYHATPTENVEDISIILANRSAALFHMEMYDLAISDIELAMTNYPKNLMYKIEECKAKCLLAKNDLHKALQHFLNTLRYLEDSGMPDDMCEKLKQDVQIQIQILLKKPRNKSNISNNVLIEKLHESVGFDYNENEGNFAVAKKDIKIGEQILVQKPHCAVLLKEYCKTNCQHCFQRTIAPLPCPTCSNVVFCGKDCRDVALGSYHKYECAILPIIYSYNTIFSKEDLSLRMISQHNLDYFLNLKDELKNGITFEDTLKLPSNDYRKVYNLVRHENQRHKNEFVVLASISTMLVHLLKLSDYFQSDTADDEIYYIGGLILRNLQFAQFNTQAVEEGPPFITLGKAIYPTLARFNHSCIPNIHKMYKGTTIIVHSITTFKSGDMIADNYGPTYNLHLIKERQGILNKWLRFKCNCCACKEDWPIDDKLEMDEHLFRFKCAGTKPCSNVLKVPIITATYKIKCNRCRQFTNISKNIASAESIFVLELQAYQYFNNGAYDKALAQYIEILTTWETILVPPHLILLILQEKIIDCLLSLNSK